MRVNKKKYTRWLTTLLVVLFVVGGATAAGKKGEQQVYRTHDDSPALRIHNTSKYKCVITIAGDSNSGNTVVIGSTSTTVDMSGTAIDTIAELAAAIEAATDDDSKTPLEVESYTGAAATSESVDDELMVEAVTIEAGDWGELEWDTSDTKHYGAYVPRAQDGNARGTVRVKSVYGSIGGTGDITLVGYLNQVECFRKVIDSPIYKWSAAGTTETWAADDVTPGEIDIPVDIIVGTDKGFLMRASRATTGTTGGIGIRVEEQ